MNFYDELLTAGQRDSQSNTGDAILVTGIVKENWNKEDTGKVKVEYLIGEEGNKISGWVRVMSAYCGGNYGYYSLPEIGTEVLIGFLQGDYKSPVVLGCLWNEEDKLPEKTPDSKNNQKLWKTKGGHEIVLNDEKGKEKLTISTPIGLKIQMEDENEVIHIVDKDGKNTAVFNGKIGTVEMKADKKMKFTCGKTSLTLDGGTNKITITADQIEVKGSQSLKAQSQSLNLEGNMTQIKAQGSLKAESSGIVQIKGAMLKLN